MGALGTTQKLIIVTLRCVRKEREQRNKRVKVQGEKKKSGAYNFLQNSKWGPFWQQAAAKPQNGATLELRGGGGGGW